MNHAVLSISVEITKKDGNKIPNNSKVALGNNFSFLDGMRTFCLIKSIFLFLANNGVNALFQSSELELNGVGKSIFKLKVLDRA